VIIRCVLRAFLCGQDPYSGKNYEHRRQWIVDKIKSLSDVFAIDICAYAIMSNHYHLVLHVNEAEVQSWDTNTVIERWYELFKGNFLVDRYRAGDVLSEAERDVVSNCADVWRKRLKDISWYMRFFTATVTRG